MAMNLVIPYLGGVVIGYLFCLWLVGEALLKHADQDNAAVRALCDRLFWSIVPWPVSRLLDRYARRHHEKKARP